MKTALKTDIGNLNKAAKALWVSYDQLRQAINAAPSYKEEQIQPLVKIEPEDVDAGVAKNASALLTTLKGLGGLAQRLHRALNSFCGFSAFLALNATIYPEDVVLASRSDPELAADTAALANRAAALIAMADGVATFADIVARHPLVLGHDSSAKVSEAANQLREAFAQFRAQPAAQTQVSEAAAEEADSAAGLRRRVKTELGSEAASAANQAPVPSAPPYAEYVAKHSARSAAPAPMLPSSTPNTQPPGQQLGNLQEGDSPVLVFTILGALGALALYCCYEIVNKSADERGR